MQIFRPQDGFAFALGEIGVHDLTEFLDSLPRIRIIYNAPPNPEAVSFWHKYEKVSYSYDEFWKALTTIYKAIKPDEFYVEVDSIKNRVLDFFHKWKQYPFVEYRDLIYSAPLNGRTNGMAKRRKVTGVVIASKWKANTNFSYTYSHEFLNGVLNQKREYKVLFDPCIGKGLALRAALKYGYQCYGIEFSKDRLSCTLEYLERNHGANIIPKSS